MTEAQQQGALEQARQGDSRALGALLDSFRPYFRVLVRELHRGDPLHAPDDAVLYQEVVLEAQHTFDRFPGSCVGEFRDWLRSLVQASLRPTLHVQPGHAADSPVPVFHLAGRQDTMQGLDASVSDSGPAAGERKLPVSPAPAAGDSWATWDGAVKAPRVQIGRYTILQTLGSGGMGVVYKANDPQLDRAVAIKVPRFDGARQASAVARSRFLREARAAAAIRHPHVCPIHDVGEQEGVPYVVMAFVEGQSLAERLSSQHRFGDCAAAVRLAREIAEALAAVHAHGIVHRDLKPANILLDSAGHAVLTDFGLSRFENDVEHLTEEGALTGTPAYMSPEQARRAKADPQSDLFSLGSVLYEVFTGELPFKGRDAMALLSSLALDTPTPAAKLNPALPRELADLVMELLAKDPSDRPRSAQEVVERLGAIERTQECGQTPVATTTPLELSLRRKSDAAGIRPIEKLKNLRRSRGKRRRLTATLLVAVLAAGFTTAAAVWLGGSAARSTTDSGAAVGAEGTAEGKAGPLPLKIVLLAGQSNMSGRAAISTLDAIDDDPALRWMLAKIKNKDGSWKVREDVWVSFQRERELRQGRLSVGFGQSDKEVGPELLFGHVLGDASENPILLVKVTQGPMNLGVESRPPSSGGVTGPFYQRMITTVRQVLADPKAHFPRYEGQGCEIAGFVWFQGWNDHLRPNLLAEYQTNLVNLIKDVRRDLGVPNLPVVIGEVGIDGKKPTANMRELRRAQAAAAGRPEFAGSVALVETSAFWDEQAETVFRYGYDRQKNKWRDEKARLEFERLGGSNPGFLYLGSGKILSRIGHAFAEAMKELWARQARAP